MTHINSFISKIIRTGIRPESTVEEEKEIVLGNSFAWLSILITLLMTIISAFYSINPIWQIGSALILVYIICIYWISIQKILLAKMVFIVIVNASLVAQHLLVGKLAGFHYYIICVFAGYFVVFSLKEIRYIISFMVYTALLIMYGLYIGDGYNLHLTVDKSTLELFGNINFFNVIIIMTFFFGMTARESQRVEKELRTMMHTAESANKAKSDFLSVISHEIRTPLNAIIGMSALLKENENNAEEQEKIGIIKSGANTLLLLVNEILDYSKIEDGHITLNTDKHDLKTEISSLFNLFQYQAKAKGLEIELQLSSKIANTLDFDNARMKQILGNLIVNAIKFTQKGKIIISGRVISETETHQTLELSVIDQGIGIAKDKVDYIFERFTQEDKSIGITYGGAGLGLSISQKLAELMDSKICVESEKGVGSKFSLIVDLPKSVNSLPKNTEMTNDILRLSGKQVLIVDDNFVNQKILQKYLSKWSIEYKTASDGNQAIDLIKENQFDLVLMDLLMPNKNGYEAAKEVRESLQNKTLPIVALTAHAENEVREEVLEAGMNDVISKPFTTESLQTVLLEYIK